MDIFDRHRGFQDTPTRNFLNLLLLIVDLMRCDADDWAERETQHLEGLIATLYDRLDPAYAYRLEAAFPDMHDLVHWPQCQDYYDKFNELFDVISNNNRTIREDIIARRRD